LDGNGQVASANMACRVIQNDGQTLLLAGEDAGEVYTVTADMAGVAAALQVGSKVKVTWDGLMQENNYPAKLGALKTITAVEGEFNDLCAVYLKVLEDLWNTDTKLNANLSALGVDLSKTSLSAGERGAVAWAFGQAHGLPAVQGTLQELASSGYIKENAWKGGCLFTITEKSTAGKKLTFDAQKWASSSGSDSFNSCTTTQASDGRWSSYQIGSQTNKTS
jgi:hypothetical protein